LTFPLAMLVCVVRVSYVDGLAIGSVSWCMYWSHDVCIGCVLFEVNLGSFLCSRFDGRVRVVRRVDMASSRLVLMRCWSPHLRLALIAFVLSMCTSMCPVGDRCFYRNCVQFVTPSSHIGAKCLRSLSEKLSGRHWVLICLPYSFGGRFLGILSRCLALVSSISLDAFRRLVAMWLVVCRFGMCSNSALVMFWTYDRTLSVGSLARLAS
jgi:hypothetical protein